MVILFVVLVFRFHDFGAGRDLLPRLPVPPLSPLAVSLAAEPLDIG